MDCFRFFLFFKVPRFLFPPFLSFFLSFLSAFLFTQKLFTHCSFNYSIGQFNEIQYFTPLISSHLILSPIALANEKIEWIIFRWAKMHSSFCSRFIIYNFFSFLFFFAWNLLLYLYLISARLVKGSGLSKPYSNLLRKKDWIRMHISNGLAICCPYPYSVDPVYISRFIFIY